MPSVYIPKKYDAAKHCAIRNNLGDRAKANAIVDQALATLTKVKRDGARPAYTDWRLMAYRLADYLHAKQESGEPITKTGLRMSLNLNPQGYIDYRNGDKDSLSMACDETGTPLLSREGDVADMIAAYADRDELAPIYGHLVSTTGTDGTLAFSDLIKNAEDFFNEQVEKYTFTRGNVVDIFNSKVHLGYQDESRSNSSGTVNNTLVINGAQAERALEHLGFRRRGE